MKNRSLLAISVLASISLCFTVQVGAPVAAQQKALIWSGFQHSWNYNHRYNRLGDFIQDGACAAQTESCHPAVVHTGASGLGPDTARAVSSWWQISSNKASFAETTASFTLKGTKGTDLERDQTIRIPLNNRYRHFLRKRKNYVALINGFDLVANGESGKLTKLELSTSSVHYNAKHRYLSLKVKALGNLTCTTKECTTSTTISYSLKVNVLVIGGDAGLTVNEKNFERYYRWRDQDKTLAGGCSGKLETQNGPIGSSFYPQAKRVDIQSKRRASTALLGFRSLSFEANDELHMLDFGAQIKPVAYNGKRYKFDLNLIFTNWRNGMQSSYLPYSDCATADPGNVTWQARVALVQLGGNSKAAYKSANCSIDWPGFERKADDPLAECITPQTY